MDHINHGIQINNHKKIINQNNPFDYSIYDEIIFDEDYSISKKYTSYKQSAFKQFQKVKTIFPFLTMTMLPTVKPSSLIIKGYLITNELCKKIDFSTQNMYEKFSIEIVAIVPFDYQKNGISVFDARNKINFNNVDHEFVHKRFSPLKTGRKMLCTHKDSDIKPNNAILGVLQSAEHLYIEYRKLERTGEFSLECHPHG